MGSSRTYLDPRNLAKIDGLRLRARHVVEGFVTGLHRSPFRGFSIEFSEHREYTSGDDLRYLDWKVLGRTNKLYVKQFEDETNLIAYLAVDESESMAYRSDPNGMSKYDYAATLAASLAWIVLAQQDAASLATYDERVNRFVRASTDASHLNELVEVLEQPSFAPITSIAGSIEDLAPRFGRRGIVLIFSDFFDDLNRLEKSLLRLKQSRHHVHLVQILDHAELEFPFQTPTQFLGMEKLPNIVADARAIRSVYLDELEEFMFQLNALAKSLQCDCTTLSTNTDIAVALQSILNLGGPS